MVYGWQYDQLPCPFCDKGQISCKWYPSATSVKNTGRTSLGGKPRLQKSKEVWLILSGCSVCGKSQEEVEKELKNKGMV